MEHLIISTGVVICAAVGYLSGLITGYLVSKKTEKPAQQKTENSNPGKKLSAHYITDDHESRILKKIEDQNSQPKYEDVW
jgi:hypothetical protein